MGREARCFVEYDGGRTAGTAHLETDHLLFRGDVRLRIAIASVTAVAAQDGRLAVTWPGGTAVFELGTDAARWAERIQRPPSLLDKLGVKPGSRVLLVGQFDESFRGALADHAADVSTALRPENDVILLAAASRGDLAHLGALQAHVRRGGAVWVVRPKGRPEITERDTMAAGRSAGLVDVKVARFSATHTAEKFVIPLARR